VGALAARYRAALWAAEKALTRGLPMVYGEPRPERSANRLRKLRSELSDNVAERPNLLSPRFDKYVEAVLSHCGYRVQDARAHLQAGLERLAEPLLASGALDEKSFEALYAAMERAAEDARALGPVDRIVVCTGQRPDLAMTRELRLDLDPWLESTRTLGPMIDPNLHSCGTVPPHGYRALAHPEPNYFAVGIKSYGRAPTFLMATGYEQVRSVAAHLAGDEAAATDVRLVLPETGVCTADLAGSAEADAGCCGGPAPAGIDACCVKDAEARESGASGCGCGGTETKAAAATS